MDATMSYECLNGPLLRQPFKGSRFGQLVLSGPGVRNASPIPGIPSWMELLYKRAEVGPVASSIHKLLSKESPKRSIYPPEIEKRTMPLSSCVACGLLLILNLQLFSTYPVGTSLTSSDMDILKLLLDRLEETLPEQTEIEQRLSAERDNTLDDLNIEADAQQPRDVLDEGSVREFLSAKNLKSIRSDSSRRSSGCFGRRMDRIGSMSSLGCNRVGKYNPK
ncbi:natriuretic peptides B [Phyllopteryx taeniolatus]|uniref:natriuretic peptides B n=1 Tax=Phyllopteryx taeniolatus TaxID=161469 RepID=UPI002AD297DF|nr:natriuretic peptides B [Phyllopteryx taeniolatus]